MIEQQLVLAGGTTPEEAAESLSKKLMPYLQLGWALHGQTFTIPDPRSISGSPFFTLAQQVIRSF